MTDSWVLTSAHCLIDLNRKTTFILDPVDFTVTAGRTVITSGKKEGQERQVKMFVIHSRFKRPQLKYNVGLVQTTAPFILGPYTQPAVLYTMPPEVVTFFSSCNLIGWNSRKHSFDDYEGPEMRPNTMKLEKMEVKLMGLDKCVSILKG